MIDDDSGGEDEWRSVQRRFSREGLEWGELEPPSRTLHVWRWLVDAEANLKAARHISDKLRREHHQEKEELEEYSKHLREKSEDRVRVVEAEMKQLRGDLEAMVAAAAAVAAMMEKEGLTDLALAPLQEQIAYLLVERSKLTEELDAARTKPASDREKDLTAQLIKVSTDLELLKHTHQETEGRLAEMTDRVGLLEKASHQLELDNETLAYKLSEALAEIEDNEGQLRRFIKNPPFRRGESPRTSLRSLEESSLGSGVFRRDSSRGSGRKKSLELMRVERGKSPRSSQRRKHHNRSVSTAGKEATLDSDEEDRAAGKEALAQRMNRAFRRSSSVDRPFSYGPGEAVLREEVKRMQGELAELRKDLLVAEDKFEYGIRKYELYKIKSRNKVLAVKSIHKSEMEALQQKLNKLEAELSLKSDQVVAEESLRKQLEGDLTTIRTERQDMATRMRECERISQDRSQEVSLLQERVQLMQDTNKQLSDKLQELSVAAMVG